MSTMKADVDRLGWLQTAILTLLWNREMYGLEIQKHLDMQAHPSEAGTLERHRVSSGQLYSALKKLKNAEFICAREEVRIGPSRIYYKTTDTGKMQIRAFIIHFLSLLYSVFEEHVGLLSPDLEKNIPILPGTVVIDFSIQELEQIMRIMTPKVGSTGRYLFTYASEEQKSLYKEKFDHYGLSENIKLLKREELSIPDLPPASCDYALCFFTLHEPKTEWILPEMRRVLKPNGRAFILDLPDLPDHLFLNFLKEFSIIGRFGVNPIQLEKICAALGFHVEKKTIQQGVFLLDLTLN